LHAAHIHWIALGRFIRFAPSHRFGIRIIPPHRFMKRASRFPYHVVRRIIPRGALISETIHGGY
ncbi:hypothetical protein, partial [Burkholderia cenocepacia]|uniref:hypothetical protein n=1 Tax=Burkholderia cenocepacia TaxID=95486 RepID=UPI002236F447